MVRESFKGKPVLPRKLSAVLVEDIGRRIVNRLRVLADLRHPSRTISTTLHLTGTVTLLLESVAQMQQITKKDALVVCLDAVLDDILQVRKSQPLDELGVIGNIIRQSRLPPHEGFYCFSIRMPLRIHRKLKDAAYLHDVRITRVVCAVIHSLGPYLTSHPYNQLDLFEKS
jgi:hypothetical protein